MKRILSLILALALTVGVMLTATSCGEPEIKINPDKQEYVVGICQLIQHDALDAATQGFKDGLTAALAAEGRTVVFNEQNANGDSTTCSTIVNSFISADVDLMKKSIAC